MCLSLMIGDAEHLFMYLLAMGIYSLTGLNSQSCQPPIRSSAIEGNQPTLQRTEEPFHYFSQGYSLFSVIISHFRGETHVFICLRSFSAMSKLSLSSRVNFLWGSLHFSEFIYSFIYVSAVTFKPHFNLGILLFPKIYSPFGKFSMIFEHFLILSSLANLLFIWLVSSTSFGNKLLL